MRTDSRKIIEMENLRIGYRRHSVAEGIADCISNPCIVALIGPNGVGKSTLLKTLTGELRPLSGDVRIEGKQPTDYSRRELARILALVSTETDSSAGGLTVRELVSLGRQPFTGFFGHLSADDEKAVDEAMERVGIAGKSASFICNLSDGERQKAMIARALAQETPIIILDEPFSFLDPTARIEIFTMMRREASENGKVIILSTHDVAQALRLADRLWMMGNGRFFCKSPSDKDVASVVSSIFKSEKAVFSPEIMDFTAAETQDVSQRNLTSK